MGNSLGHYFGYDTQSNEEQDQEEEQKFQACLDKSSPTSDTIVISGISQANK